MSFFLEDYYSVGGKGAPSNAAMINAVDGH